MASATDSRPSTQSQSNGGNTTPALVPSTSSTKRLSTFNTKPNASSSPAKVGGGGGGSAVAGGGAAGGLGAVKEVVSPGELCGFVDTLLAQLENRFDEMSEQVLGRMEEMSSRIDHLETTIQDLMHGDIEST
ncbi:hypothetical protein CI109_102364 [Kwoniella shandongensis]|uniref:Uncharacterized protein n=1 Tax=Kwoniella shandongensis TaxID=1734106 RepID=A0A5M6BZV5_9TREE|nr:uncharacterized protein CI109_003318 [Kwoniella shandongensis]KAA5528418.1 hypothetical protein CI109_003318 [Kwoniella shandongensis]